MTGMITFKGQNLKYLPLQVWHNFSILALVLRTAELLTATVLYFEQEKSLIGLFGPHVAI